MGSFALVEVRVKNRDEVVKVDIDWFGGCR